MKVLICGSGRSADVAIINCAVEASGFHVTEIISGGAKGVDSLAEKYAAAKNIPTRIFHPVWKKFGKRAGIVRNLEMIKESEAVIAIWDGKSRGTKSTIDYAEKENKPIYILHIEDS